MNMHCRTSCLSYFLSRAHPQCSVVMCYGCCADYQKGVSVTHLKRTLTTVNLTFEIKPRVNLHLKTAWTCRESDINQPTFDFPGRKKTPDSAAFGNGSNG